ncbi:Ankyrin repeat-containing protein [Modestobacter sp. DSM 44400]|uniref:ankyrin repeat domain-containing protein n=1 Tax=Modestobacter sp. DSM 44400 TaxID=1550230 RepID=UPI000894FFCF|nr:ankyrin repeat domain-containing protein [Modestobacter sp. DSM 44400]SDX46576.1 Ankyrin repeat-containing protein [Modestobacter sp. DSM 44400]
MTTRMTAPRLGRLIADGDLDGVRAAVQAQPRLLTARVERAGEDGWTALHLAVVAGSADLVEALVAAGADLTAATEGGRTPLHVALQYAPDLIGALRGLGAPVDAASAAFLGDVDRLAGELDDGTRLTDPATDVDLLSWAASGGSLTAVQLLLDRGADPDAGALHAAAATARPQVVERLLAAGADVDRRDRNTGRTALHAAVDAPPTGNVPAVVRLLLAAGADVNATTNDGASALDICRVASAQSRGTRAAGTADPDALAELLVASGARN